MPYLLSGKRLITRAVGDQAVAFRVIQERVDLVGMDGEVLGVIKVPTVVVLRLSDDAERQGITTEELFHRKFAAALQEDAEQEGGAKP